MVRKRFIFLFLTRRRLAIAVMNECMLRRLLRHQCLDFGVFRPCPRLHRDLVLVRRMLRFWKRAVAHTAETEATASVSSAYRCLNVTAIFFCNPLANLTWESLRLRNHGLTKPYTLCTA